MCHVTNNCGRGYPNIIQPFLSKTAIPAGRSRGAGSRLIDTEVGFWQEHLKFNSTQQCSLLSSTIIARSTESKGVKILSAQSDCIWCWEHLWRTQPVLSFPSTQINSFTPECCQVFCRPQRSFTKAAGFFNNLACGLPAGVQETAEVQITRLFPISHWVSETAVCLQIHKPVQKKQMHFGSVMISLTHTHTHAFLARTSEGIF